MKKNMLLVTLVWSVCLVGSFFSFNQARAVTGPSGISVNHTPLWQQRAQPFCRFTYVDHYGHSIKLQTDILHASSRSLTFIFESGEKLIINFTMIRAGHFVAESARSKDPQIIFYPSHQSYLVPMIGAVIISGTKPISGNFSHLISDDEEHITLVSGTFSF